MKNTPIHGCSNHGHRRQNWSLRATQCPLWLTRDEHLSQRDRKLVSKETGMHETNYSRTSEQRTLWDRGFCPLFRGCPLLGDRLIFAFYPHSMWFKCLQFILFDLILIILYMIIVKFLMILIITVAGMVFICLGI